jgi:L-fuconolactonase
VTRILLAQAAQTEAETDILLTIAVETDFIEGVTGWLDLSDVRFPDRLAHYRMNPKFLAGRPMLQDLADDGWIMQPSLPAGLGHLRTVEIPHEFLVLTLICPRF